MRQARVVGLVVLLGCAASSDAGPASPRLQVVATCAPGLPADAEIVAAQAATGRALLTPSVG